MRLSEPCRCGDPLCWRCFPAQEDAPDDDTPEETTMPQAAEMQMVPHPFSPHHRLVIARTRTRVYAVTYAEPFPSQAEAEALWREERRAFRPYDETRQRYCA